MRRYLKSISVCFLTCFTLNVNASQVCNTIVECNYLKSKAEERLNELLNASSINEEGIAIYGDGSAMLLTLSEASTFCSRKGFQLPTSRRIAKMAEGFGANLVETQLPKTSIKNEKVRKEINEKKSNGWSEIIDFEVDHSLPRSEKNGIEFVDFYYSTSGYIKPQGVFGSYKFWTISMVGDSNYIFQLNGTTGQLESSYLDYTQKAAVLCVSSH